MARERDCTAAEKCHLGFASRTRSVQSDEESAEQLQEVDHPEARIAHRGICASPDTIFGSHKCAEIIALRWYAAEKDRGRRQPRERRRPHLAGTVAKLPFEG